MRSFPVKVGRIVDYILADGRRRPSKVIAVVSGQTVNLKELSSGTVRNSVTESTVHGTTGVWKRP